MGFTSYCVYSDWAALDSQRRRELRKVWLEIQKGREGGMVKTGPSLEKRGLQLRQATAAVSEGEQSSPLPVQQAGLGRHGNGRCLLG